MRTLLLSFLLVLAPAAGAAEYVAIAKRGVNIRAAPSTDSKVVARARFGDVFEVFRREGDWIGIIMFSGKDRFVYAPLVRTVANLPPLPPRNLRRQACSQISAAHDRASREAQELFRNHFDLLVERERFLIDRYQLPIFHRLGISPAHNGRLVTECVASNWR
ncbi:MAG: SH3 domain-containing protein [Gammaproteobacteria bacterium]|nr:SH3 domain-containing protein [Gammaproteobacteria bacterium]NNM20011.1 SH3 domain-containing protein [Gammaproteobacteria bacterium]